MYRRTIALDDGIDEIAFLKLDPCCEMSLTLAPREFFFETISLRATLLR